MPRLTLLICGILVAACAPIAAQEAGSDDPQIMELRRLVHLHNDCVLDRVIVYMSSSESAGDIADAAMADCNGDFVAVEQHIESMFKTSPDASASVSAYAQQAADGLIDKARRGARSAAVSAVVSARTQP